MRNTDKKSWKRFLVALIITITLVGGVVYNFILIGLGLQDKSLALNNFLDIIINPFIFLIGAWIGADTVGNNLKINKRKK